MQFAETDEGSFFAYRPREVITTEGDEALRIARQLFPRADREKLEIGPFSRLIHIDDPILLVEELRLHGIVAQPNHVYFAHPVYGDPVYGDPVYGDPVYGDPVYGDPVYGDPVYGDPASGSRVRRTALFGRGSRRSRPVERDRSSALPPPPHTETKVVGERIRTARKPGSPKVFVLDTGLAAEKFRPPLGDGIKEASSADVDRPDEDGDNYLDPTAGHGTFIAGVIAQIAPGCDITVHRVLSTFGDGDEWKISHCIRHLPISKGERTILSLSFGGYVLDRPYLMAWTIRHIQHQEVTVVASAGNDATSRPLFPAALPAVVAVGALGSTGPAPFTNYGDWVDACAPGCDLLSTFFTFDGPAPVGPYGRDPDDFQGWALWSGTSFSAPVVVGNLARMMMADGSPAGSAVARLIDGPSLASLRYLGTIVDAM